MLRGYPIIAKVLKNKQIIHKKDNIEFLVFFIALSSSLNYCNIKIYNPRIPKV